MEQQGRLYLVGEHGVSCDNSLERLLGVIPDTSDPEDEGDDEYIFTTYIPEGTIIEVIDIDRDNKEYYQILIRAESKLDKHPPGDMYTVEVDQVVYTTDHGLFSACTLRLLITSEEKHQW